MCLRRWEPARLPGPGRRAHKDRDVSRPGSSGPGTGSTGHPEFSGSRGGGGRAGRASSPTRAPAPARPRHSPRVLGFLKIQEPRGEHRGGSIGLQPGAPTAATRRGRGAGAAGRRAGAGGGRGRPGAVGGGPGAEVGLGAREDFSVVVWTLPRWASASEDTPFPARSRESPLTVSCRRACGAVGHSKRGYLSPGGRERGARRGPRAHSRTAEHLGRSVSHAGPGTFLYLKSFLVFLTLRFNWAPGLSLAESDSNCDF